jgi:site-specific DNA-methyltransferase (adenine-specific)
MGDVGIQGGNFSNATQRGEIQIRNKPVTSAAKQWDGWGTALKPALEPITLARKPLDGTVAANVLEWGTGGINVDGCRVGVTKRTPGGTKGSSVNSERCYAGGFPPRRPDVDSGYAPNIGRWPANLIHDGSDEVLAGFPETSKSTTHSRRKQYSGCFAGSCDTSPTPKDGTEGIRGHSDSGSAARFFYVAKASKRDRNDGCEGMPLGGAPGSKKSKPAEGRQNALGNPRENFHPTVKPADLMRYLCRLITPPGGIVLDPFMGSGSTGKAAAMDGFRFIGIDREADYIGIAKARIVHALEKQAEMLDFKAVEGSNER